MKKVPRRAARALAVLRRAVRRRPSSKLEASILVAGIVAIGVTVLWDARRDAMENAGATAVNLVSLLHEQTAIAFHTSDRALLAAERWLERESIPQNDPVFRSDLTLMREGVDYLRALFVIGPDGFIIHDTDYPDTPRVSLADRGYFEVHRDNRDVGIFVGEPLLSRSMFSWFLPVARRVDAPDGRFAGVVVAAIEPLFFEHTYRRLQLKESDAIALFHQDGTLIARVPPLPESYGRNMSNLQLFAANLPEEESGVFPAQNLYTGSESIVAYRKVDGLPLVLTVALDRAGALAGWQRFVWVVSLAALLMAALVLLLYTAIARRRLERQVARQKALTAEKLEAVGLMTSSVAHDFKNLLAATSSGLRLIRQRGPQERLLRGLEETVERGKALTYSLLRFARDQDLERRVCSPTQRINELKVLIRQTVPAGTKLVFDLSPEVDPFRVSPALFDAAVINLVVNATHAMPEGGELRIATRNRAEGGGGAASGRFVSISIADTGQGIAPHTLEHIFEPFYTTKGEGGTGLGLFQVRNFARETGGDVRIASEPGVGTEVELLIPSATSRIGKAKGAAQPVGKGNSPATAASSRPADRQDTSPPALSASATAARLRSQGRPPRVPPPGP